MKNMNKVTLIGHVGNVELRGENGKVASLVLYTKETWKDKDGKRQERSQRHALVAFKPHLVKLIGNHIAKGAYLLVEGSLDYSSYTHKDGTERYTAQIIVNEIGFLSPKSGD